MTTLGGRVLAYEFVCVEGGHNSFHTNKEIHGDRRTQESDPLN